jgi:ornithine cyclodeaminase/alanine dehydrogenase-like protein (mu-crystallin family)
VTAVSSAEAVVRGADVVVLATTSRTPVLQGEWLSPGAHVNALGSCRPDWREYDDRTFERAQLFVDSREAALKECAGVITRQAIVAELGEMVTTPSIGRRATEQITLFQSLGLAVEDVVAADLVYRAAQAEHRATGAPA